MNSYTSRRAFSAPGKALLAGGYLVLDPQYQAYSIALSARIHAIIESVPSLDGKTDFICLSPQFQNSTWVYGREQEDTVLTEMTLAASNPFLYSAIKVALAYVGDSAEKWHCKLTIYSDDGFHTQQYELTKLKGFTFHISSMDNVPKTGLGSSASLVVAVTAAVLSVVDGQNFNLSDPGYVNIIHNLAQLAHCYAQGKIGSGFDVATAVFGSILYNRFSPESLRAPLEYLSSGYYVPESKEDVERLTASIQNAAKNLEVTYEKRALPRNLTLLLGDVKGGSKTPKLVSSVLKFQKEHPQDCLTLFTSLHEQNVRLIDLLGQKGSNEENYDELSDTIVRIRHHLRKLGRDCNVPIEPVEQTMLLDACTDISGVIGGVVPGAGGYDAICLLVRTDRLEMIKKIAAIDKMLYAVPWLDLHEEPAGLLSEPTNKYPGFA